MPFLLVTDHGGGPERNPIASRWLETLGNVSFIERPFHPTTLLSVALDPDSGEYDVVRAGHPGLLARGRVARQQEGQGAHHHHG